jgi:hypothetical protein
MAFAFEKLQVYQKAIAFADGVCTLTRSFPRGYFFVAGIGDCPLLLSTTR